MYVFVHILCLCVRVCVCVCAYFVCVCVFVCARVCVCVCVCVKNAVGVERLGGSGWYSRESTFIPNLKTITLTAFLLPLSRFFPVQGELCMFFFR